MRARATRPTLLVDDYRADGASRLRATAQSISGQSEKLPTEEDPARWSPNSKKARNGP
jgi:hypothetical protein